MLRIYKVNSFFLKDLAYPHTLFNFVGYYIANGISFCGFIMKVGLFCIKILLFVAVLLCWASCSVYKYVPADEYLLTNVSVKVEDAKIQNVSKYKSLSKQTPNSRVFGLFRIPLRMYSLLGGKEGKIGEAPVLYDSIYAMETARDMRKLLVNSGYLNADVHYKTEKYRRRKIDVEYILNPGEPYVVENIKSVIEDETIASIIKNSNTRPLLNKGMKLDVVTLDNERIRIVEILQKQGYYRFDKSFITFQADTIANSKQVDLTMFIDGDSHKQYEIGDITYVLTDNTNYSLDNYNNYNVQESDGFRILYDSQKKRPELKQQTLSGHSFLREGMLYNTDSITKTYSTLSKLSFNQYSNIVFDVDEESDKLNTSVFFVKRPKHSLRLEAEGTNTSGDFGAAAALSIINRNLFRGSEQFSLKVRGAYEAITSLGYSGNRYLEYGAEANLEFPSLILPLVPLDFQRKSQATTQFSLEYNAQSRPEFKKILFTTRWSYLWTPNWRQTHRIDLADWNYLTVPWIDPKFKTEYLDPITGQNSILRYNYEDLLITRIGYQFVLSNARTNAVRPLQYSFRFNLETSGNMLYAASKLLEASKNKDGQYECMDIAFAQYVKNDMSYTLNWRINQSNNLLFHVESGIALPYLNSNSVPFEKRYFAGGANSVRGWSVRELGPGAYVRNDNKIDYIKQSGDIKLGASIEYRSHLFWKFNAALFVDAGNIWTIKDYADQPGGQFLFDEFYKQIAVSYGAGLRLDFNFLVVRLDMGVKAINPNYTSGKEKYPILNPNLKRDLAFHFAVGYPF